ncbi:hypothetical protein GUJ93_ZPchr0012g18793 [Zizania palustris]|uniref:Uncharacterized protein n=1 Tax=Zizania palustris TaxID=103762 RepID=A0A8J5WSZ9_ZIZPA|nr:hypothetical protein GUJ93_ZPchr0012g18793 [Zizania palustris]
MARRDRRYKPSSSDPEAEQPEALSRILRTEAAASGVSRKAIASRQQSTSLWPRAVLEALDSAFASNRWESAQLFSLLDYWRPEVQALAEMFGGLSAGDTVEWCMPENHHAVSPFHLIWCNQIPPCCLSSTNLVA